MRSRSFASKSAESSGVMFKDMYSVVNLVLFQMEPPAAPTIFVLDEQEVFDNLVYQIKRDCPTLRNKVENL